MQKTSARELPAANEAVALLQAALAQGHAVTLSLAAPPLIIRPPPMVVICTARFGLTLSESRVFAALLEHGYVDRKELHAAMSGGKVTSDITTLNVVVSRVRQKLAAHNVRITTVWKSGYRLDEKSRSKLREMLAPAASENAKTET